MSDERESLESAMLAALIKVMKHLDLFDYALLGWELEQEINELIAQATETD